MVNSISLRFRSTHGDLGPFEFPLSVLVHSIRERLLADWPTGELHWWCPCISAPSMYVRPGIQGKQHTHKHTHTVHALILKHRHTHHTRTHTHTHSETHKHTHIHTYTHTHTCVHPCTQRGLLLRSHQAQQRISGSFYQGSLWRPTNA